MICAIYATVNGHIWRLRLCFCLEHCWLRKSLRRVCRLQEFVFKGKDFQEKPIICQNRRRHRQIRHHHPPPQCTLLQPKWYKFSTREVLRKLGFCCEQRGGWCADGVFAYTKYIYVLHMSLCFGSFIQNGVKYCLGMRFVA